MDVPVGVAWGFDADGELTVAATDDRAAFVEDLSGDDDAKGFAVEGDEVRDALEQFFASRVVPGVGRAGGCRILQRAAEKGFGVGIRVCVIPSDCGVFANDIG